MTDKTFRDFLGQELAVGDRVIINDVGGYQGFDWGTVDSFTPKNVRVVVGERTTWNGSPRTKVMPSTSTIKMGEEQQHYLTAKILKS